MHIGDPHEERVMHIGDPHDHSYLAKYTYNIRVTAEEVRAVRSEI